MATIAFMLGGLVPTLIVSRLLLLVMRSWDGGVTRLITVHVFSLLIAALIAGMAMADWGTFVPIRAAGLYALPQAFWFAVDMLLRWRRSRAPTKSDQS